MTADSDVAVAANARGAGPRTPRGSLARLAALIGCGAVVAACGAGSSTNSFSATTPAATSSTGTAATARPVTSKGRAAATAVAGADWPTFDFDSQRTGVGPAATGITASNLRSLRRQIIRLDGTVDSSPVELHAAMVNGVRRDVLFVTAAYGRTLAIDARTGKRLWQYTPPDIGGYQRTAQVTTATPVVDPGRRFVFAASPDGLIHKLSVATGAELRSALWPARVTYDPTREKLASALNISGASLIVVTGGYYGDAPVYQGHVVTIDRASGAITHVFNTLCSDRRALINPPRRCPFSDSAIWARAGAVVEPGSRRMLVATGNGKFDGRTNWGDSVLELSPAARLLHNWTPRNESAFNGSDTDLGSTAPAIVTAGGRRLGVQGGKDGKLHLLDLARLNGTAGPPGPRRGGALQAVPSPGAAEVLTAPAVWSAGGRHYVFVADDGGTAAYLVHGGARPGITRAWGNSTAGTSPVLAGGLLYVYDPAGGALDIYAPRSGRRLASLAAHTGHWNSPIVVGGRIVLPVGSYHDHATSGELYIWHLPGY